MYAVMHSLPIAPKKLDPDLSLLVESGSLETKGRYELKLFLSNIDTQIAGPCCAVPYNFSRTPIDEKTWLFLKTRSNWYSILCDHLEEYLTNLDGPNKLDMLPNKQQRSSIWRSIRDQMKNE